MKSFLVPAQLQAHTPLVGRCAHSNNRRIASALKPLLAFLLVLALGPLSASAQTRLNASQVPTLSGAVEGSVNSSTLRDVISAKDHGNGVTNGIQSAIASCGTTVSCPVTVPYFYPLTETVPGFALDPNNPDAPGNTPGNVTIFDQRYGDARMANNPAGYTDSSLTTPNGWVYNYSAKQSPMAILSPLYILQNSFDGGTNAQQSSLNYYDKTTWTPLSLTNYSHTPGQHVSETINTSTFSVGDSLGIANYVNCFGGFNAQSDEGCEAQDNQVYMGNVAYAGTLAGTPSPSAATVTVNPTQGAHTQGTGRFLVDLTTGPISAGNISSINTGAGLTTLTGSGTSWPVSTVIAQLGTAVNAPGVATITPASFSVGSMSNITTSTLVCVADGSAFEMVTPSAVTATTFTATFTKAHTADATIAAGGVCGYVLDLTADDVTNSTFPFKFHTITGTLRFAWPAVASTSATSLEMYVAGGGGYQSLVSRWNASSANGYVLYPAAEVISTQQNGYISDTLTLAPNSVQWTAGDHVEELLYPATHFTYGNTVLESYYPNFWNAAGGLSINYNMPLQGNDAMLQLSNNAPSSMYQAHGGTYASPWGVHIAGETRLGLIFDQPSDNWTFGIGCASPCTSNINVMAAGNHSFYDFMQYDEAQGAWAFTANSASGRYVFQVNKFATPFNASMGTDSSSVGYVAAPSFRTGASGNTDSAGELSFNNATSASYTLQGAYGSHPECTAEPQFDPGASNRHWITYTGTGSFTINFATAVSGSVSYVCVARN